MGWHVADGFGKTVSLEGVHSRPLEGLRPDPQVPMASGQSGSQSVPRYDLVKVRGRGRIGALG